jgi:hypothetical protein
MGTDMAGPKGIALSASPAGSSGAASEKGGAAKDEAGSEKTPSVPVVPAAAASGKRGRSVQAARVRLLQGGGRLFGPLGVEKGSVAAGGEQEDW